MRSQPLVSIIVPCYNADRFIADAIQSALDQTYQNKEIIVVDDGSQDGSLYIIRSFGNSIRWESGPNRGGSAARNRGLALARGDLIQFLDADDMLFPRRLERMVPAAVLVGRSGMAICDWESVGLDSEEATSQSVGYGGEDPVVFCLGNQLQTSSPLHWRANLEAIGGFNESLPCSQERDLHLRLACTGVQFSYVPEVLYRVRRRSGSVSDDYTRVLAQHESIFTSAADHLRRSGSLTEDRAAAFAEALARDARRLVKLNESEAASRYFGAAIKLSRMGALRAFDRSVARLLARCIGPIRTERVVAWARAFGGG